MLKNGQIPIYEPAWTSWSRTTSRGAPDLHHRRRRGVAGVDVILLAVGTPPAPDGSADLQYIFKAAETAAKALTGWAVFVTKSTVPVGTGDKIEALLRQHAEARLRGGLQPRVPQGGRRPLDFMKPDRVILGTSDKKAMAVLEALYKPFTKSTDRILKMDRRSAELTKYAANSMLATRISFMNDLANLCEIVGADIELVRMGMGSDNRIGTKFLYAGAGFGGSCFPKDLRACVNTAVEAAPSSRSSTPWWPSTSARSTAWAEDPEALRRQRGRQEDRQSGASRSSPAPTTSARLPPWCLMEDMLKAGATVAATDPVAISAARAVVGDRVTLDESHHKWRGRPTPWRWSPSGTSSAAPTSPSSRA
jgi:UDPglucose 6-dehydrogenase